MADRKVGLVPVTDEDIFPTLLRENKAGTYATIGGNPEAILNRRLDNTQKCLRLLTIIRNNFVYFWSKTTLIHESI